MSQDKGLAQNILRDLLSETERRGNRYALVATSIKKALDRFPHDTLVHYHIDLAIEESHRCESARLTW